MVRWFLKEEGHCFGWVAKVYPMNILIFFNPAHWLYIVELESHLFSHSVLGACSINVPCWYDDATDFVTGV